MSQKKRVLQGRIVVYLPLEQLHKARAKLITRKGMTMAAWVRQKIEKLLLED